MPTPITAVGITALCIITGTTITGTTTTGTTTTGITTTGITTITGITTVGTTTATERPPKLLRRGQCAGLQLRRPAFHRYGTLSSWTPRRASAPEGLPGRSRRADARRSPAR
ncbi:hypothetical protein CK228_34130 [Mesorhizobium sp. WSM4312]|nr:hypothetical protein CK228_34130 [Mesorhizobium sp. WSM4312]